MQCSSRSDEFFSAGESHPMRRLPPLTLLRAFEAAARHSSFKRAAAELHITPTAISHHVRSLEAFLGVRLFERRARNVEMTREAHLLYPALRDGFDNFARAIESMDDARARPSVTLSTTIAF